MEFSDDRFRAMMRGRREILAVPFPGMDFDDSESKVGIRILLDEEVDQAYADAVQHIGVVAKNLRTTPLALLEANAELLDRENRRQLVFRAYLNVSAEEQPSPDQAKRFFPSPTAVRQLDSELVDTLYAMYLNHQNYVNPLRGLTEQEVGDIASQLGKGPGAAALLGSYDAPTLRTLVHILAGQLQNSPTTK